MLKIYQVSEDPPPLFIDGADESLVEEYEVAMVEPLHDLKYVINRIFDELPHAVKDPQLKATMKDLISAMKTGYTIDGRINSEEYS